HNAKRSVVVVDLARLIHEAYEEGREIRERPRLIRKTVGGRFDQRERPLHDGDAVWNHRPDLRALLFRQRLADASRDHPGGMDSLTGDQLDGALADLAEADPVARDLRVGAQDAEDAPVGGRGVHSEEEVRG